MTRVGRSNDVLPRCSLGHVVRRDRRVGGRTGTRRAGRVPEVPARLRRNSTVAFAHSGGNEFDRPVGAPDSAAEGDAEDLRPEADADAAGAEPSSTADFISRFFPTDQRPVQRLQSVLTQDLRVEATAGTGLSRTPDRAGRVLPPDRVP